METLESKLFLWQTNIKLLKTCKMGGFYCLTQVWAFCLHPGEKLNDRGRDMEGRVKKY